MAEPVRTKMHILAEAISDDESTLARDHPVINRMLTAANYMATPEIVDLLKRGDAAKSIEALCHAGIAHLPHTPMVVEFNLEGTGAHSYVLLEETNEERVVDVWCAAYFPELEKGLAFPSPLKLAVDETGITVSKFFGDENTRILMTTSATIALAIALLMLNTKGIDKHVVEHKKLNLKRARNSRPQIPKHTVLRIGTIYRRDGTGESYNSTKHHKRMHWRSGYTRNQHFGKGNAEIKVVYIPPCIVNFVPGEEAPTPKKILKL